MIAVTGEEPASRWEEVLEKHDLPVQLTAQPGPEGTWDAVCARG